MVLRTGTIIAMPSYPIALALLCLLVFLPGEASSEVLSGHVERKGVKGDKNTYSEQSRDGVDHFGGQGKSPNSVMPDYGGSYSSSPQIHHQLPAMGKGPGQGLGDHSHPQAQLEPEGRKGSPWQEQSNLPNLQSQFPQNSFPLSFLGTWQCVTEVINSYVKEIGVGTKMVSEVKFLKRPDGGIHAVWVQPGWTESQAYAVAWSEHEARVDRTCYYFADGMQGAWASRSRDHFIMEKPTKMICKSYIDQYIDGRYLGRYRTVSILTRIVK